MCIINKQRRQREWITNSKSSRRRRQQTQAFQYLPLSDYQSLTLIHLFMLRSSKKELKHKLRKMMGIDEEMKRGGMQQWEEKGRKLDDQLTGFVEIKLAGGTKGYGRGLGSVDNEHWGYHKQIINNVSLKGKTRKWECDKSCDTLPLLSSYHVFALKSQMQQRTTICIHKMLYVTKQEFIQARHALIKGAMVPRSSADCRSDMQDYNDLLWLSSHQLSSSRLV